MWISDRFNYPIDYRKLRSQYQENSPFPNIVLDSFFSDEKMSEVEKQFPSPEEGNWWTYNNVLEKKLARNDIHRLPAEFQTLISGLQSNPFVSFLERITGIEGLIVDHTLNGGGLHQIIRGGKLHIHADYNHHPITNLDRRVNVLIYLNPKWEPKWGGNLELWNHDMTRCVKSIEPLMNRMVIFNVNDEAFHGHPDPLECPEGESRKSIALYYYTNGRPLHEESPSHSTLFKRRPQDPITEEEENLRQSRSIRRLS